MDKVKQMGRKEEICHILAVRFRKLLDFSSIDFSKLQEIRLRVGAPFLIVYGGKEFFWILPGGLLRRRTRLLWLGRGKLGRR